MVQGKSFKNINKKEYEAIIRLKDLRDTIIHSKRKPEKLPTFSHVFKESLVFDYESSILAVRDFINFYQPHWVESCDCGKDF